MPGRAARYDTSLPLTDNRLIGNRIRALRTEAGLSARGLAALMRAAGHPRWDLTIVSQVQTGRVRRATPRELKSLAAIFDTTVDDILADLTPDNAEALPTRVSEADLDAGWEILPASAADEIPPFLAGVGQLAWIDRLALRSCLPSRASMLRRLLAIALPAEQRHLDALGWSGPVRGAIYELLRDGEADDDD